MNLEWVSTTDRMPTEERKYLVGCPSADPESPLITTAWYHPDTGTWSLVLAYCAAGIRYWMPLPPLPLPEPEPEPEPEPGP